jgi:hypothetical protein
MGKTYAEQLGQQETARLDRSLGTAAWMLPSHVLCSPTHTRINTAFFHLGGNGRGQEQHLNTVLRSLMENIVLRLIIIILIPFLVFISFTWHYILIRPQAFLGWKIRIRQVTPIYQTTVLVFALRAGFEQLRYCSNSCRPGYGSGNVYSS